MLNSNNSTENYGRRWARRFDRDLYSQESTFPLVYYASSDLLVCLHWKNPRFTVFLDSNLHTRLAIVTENELAGLLFPLGTFPKNFVQIRPRFI